MMSERLWSDREISDAAMCVAARNGKEGGIKRAAMIELRAMRTSYEARIAELETQLRETQTAGTAAYEAGKRDGHEWEPVEEIVVHCVHGSGTLLVGKDGYLQATGKHGPTVAVDVTLPEWLAFCRRTRNDNDPA